MSFAALSRKSETAAASRNIATTSALRVGAVDDAFDREAGRVTDETATEGVLANARWSLSEMDVEHTQRSGRDRFTAKNTSGRVG
jgi:hypothetical protein